MDEVFVIFRLSRFFNATKGVSTTMFRVKEVAKTAGEALAEVKRLNHIAKGFDEYSMLPVPMDESSSSLEKSHEPVNEWQRVFVVFRVESVVDEYLSIHTQLCLEIVVQLESEAEACLSVLNSDLAGRSPYVYQTAKYSFDRTD